MKYFCNLLGAYLLTLLPLVKGTCYPYFPPCDKALLKSIKAYQDGAGVPTNVLEQVIIRLLHFDMGQDLM